MSINPSDEPQNELPRERLEALGSDALTSSELIAVILGSGTKGSSVFQLSKQLIHTFQNLKGLSHASVEELLQVKGIGKAQALRLKACLGLGKRLMLEHLDFKPTISTPSQAYQILKQELEHEVQENVVTLLLDTKAKLISIEKITVGTINHSLIHPREIFRAAIKKGAANIILAHNHPSGDSTPSKEDISVTKTIVQAGKLLSIPLNDHIIIGSQEFVSMREAFPIVFV